jgi:sugar lactone lactonase YvrE
MKKRHICILAVLMIVVIAASHGGALLAQAPVYKRTTDWGQLPQGLKWAAVIGAEQGPDGNIYILHRCFENSCQGRMEPPFLVFDQSGKLLRTWGAGMFVFPHGFFVASDGSVWATDARGAGGKGHQVIKFSPEGKVLMTIGKAGVAGEGPDVFNQPTDVVVAPNGDIFVADGHRETGNSRIVKFAKDGTFIKAWGKRGSAPGEFYEPHTIAMDSQGRLFVGDRVNNRIQIFDQDGKFLDQWKQFGRPSGIYISKDDAIYVADSESETSAPQSKTGMKKGIRIGNAKTGAVTGFIEDIEAATSEPSGAEGVGVDSAGNIYGAVVRRQMLERFTR